MELPGRTAFDPWKRIVHGFSLVMASILCWYVKAVVRGSAETTDSKYYLSGSHASPMLTSNSSSSYATGTCHQTWMGISPNPLQHLSGLHASSMSKSGESSTCNTEILVYTATNGSWLIRILVGRLLIYSVSISDCTCAYTTEISRISSIWIAKSMISSQWTLSTAWV